MGKLKAGDIAPDFELLNQDGKAVRLSDYRGKKNVVLYFYPKDETPGCTAEACGFRDSYEEFLDANTEVIGVSSDSVASHKDFHQNRRLPFQLLSDPEGKVQQLYGVSRSFMGLVPGRETFVIDRSGIIRLHVATQFPQPHIRKALEAVNELKEVEGN
ncbi:MAG: peroxiredoxin [Bacteroidetes bacterium]|nr:MAG: peroxiredoxin [Bacteroidota bacterium]